MRIAHTNIVSPLASQHVPYRRSDPACGQRATPCLAALVFRAGFRRSARWEPVCWEIVRGCPLVRRSLLRGWWRLFGAGCARERLPKCSRVLDQMPFDSRLVDVGVERERAVEVIETPLIDRHRVVDDRSEISRKLTTARLNTIGDPRRLTAHGLWLLAEVA
jgi:hypothetical protein